MLNQKGQTLVMFVLLLPFFFLILLVVINLSSLNSEKTKINDTVYDVILFAVNNSNIDNLEEKVSRLLEDNLDDIDYDVVISSSNIRINVRKKFSSGLSLIGVDDEISISYLGNFNTKEIDKEWRGDLWQ